MIGVEIEIFDAVRASQPLNNKNVLLELYLEQ
jgi:hypothetical protein